MQYFYTIMSILVISITLQAKDELTWVDEQVNAIKPPRISVSNSKISSLRDPFIFLEKNRTKKKEKRAKATTTVPSKSFVSNSNRVETKKTTPKKISYSSKIALSAIMNKSALINGKWYKVNQKIGSYIISKITNTNVVLTKNSKSLILSTNSKINNLEFKK